MADTRSVQAMLYWAHNRSKMLLPNYSPARWFECDFFRVSQAGYFYEYEIKTSLSDFKADKRKALQIIELDEHIGSEPKHLLLRQGDKRGPSFFYYVVPEAITGLVLEHLPAYSGLIEFRKRLRVVKKAPRLHNFKVSRHIVRHARRVCTRRYWEELVKHERL